MRPIKFRGLSIDDKPASLKGKYVYGDLIQPWETGRGTQIRVTVDDHKDVNGNIVAYCYYIEVAPDTVAQLIGVDKKGNEIYEGDEIVSLFGQHCFASFLHYGEIIHGTYSFVATRIFGGAA